MDDDEDVLEIGANNTFYFDSHKGGIPVKTPSKSKQTTPNATPDTNQFSGGKQEKKEEEEEEEEEEEGEGGGEDEEETEWKERGASDAFEDVKSKLNFTEDTKYGKIYAEFEKEEQKARDKKKKKQEEERKERETIDAKCYPQETQVIFQVSLEATYMNKDQIDDAKYDLVEYTKAVTEALNTTLKAFLEKALRDKHASKIQKIKADHARLSTTQVDLSIVPSQRYGAFGMRSKRKGSPLYLEGSRFKREVLLAVRIITPSTANANKVKEAVKSTNELDTEMRKRGITLTSDEEERHQIKGYVKHDSIKTAVWSNTYNDMAEERAQRAALRQVREQKALVLLTICNIECFRRFTLQGNKTQILHRTGFATKHFCKATTASSHGWWEEGGNMRPSWIVNDLTLVGTYYQGARPQVANWPSGSVTVGTNGKHASSQDLTPLKDAFDKLDKDSNGTVDKKEWGHALFENRQVLGQYFGGKTLAEIGENFNRIDADESGDLTWEEVKTAAHPLDVWKSWLGTRQRVVGFQCPNKAKSSGSNAEESCGFKRSSFEEVLHHLGNCKLRDSQEGPTKGPRALHGHGWKAQHQCYQQRRMYGSSRRAAEIVMESWKEDQVKRKKWDGNWGNKNRRNWDKESKKKKMSPPLTSGISPPFEAAAFGAAAFGAAAFGAVAFTAPAAPISFSTSPMAGSTPRRRKGRRHKRR
jgi:hypothetical protein